MPDERTAHCPHCHSGWGSMEPSDFTDYPDGTCPSCASLIESNREHLDAGEIERWAEWRRQPNDGDPEHYVNAAVEALCIALEARFGARSAS